MTDPNAGPNADPTPGSPLTRRALLRAAAGLAGFLALGLETAPAQAEGTAPPALAPPALAFWDGARLLDPARMPADPTLAGTSLRITLRSQPAGARPALRALTAHFPVPDGAGTHWTPFLAWAASPGGGGRGSAFTLPVHPAEGLHLSLEHGAGPRGTEQTAEVRLSLTGGGPALRAGTYLLAPAGTDWAGCALADGGRLTVRGGGPAGFDHLLLTVAPA